MGRCISSCTVGKGARWWRGWCDADNWGNPWTKHTTIGCKFACNIKRVQKVWGGLGKMLQKEGGYTQVLEMFYRVVIQEVLMFFF